MASSIFSGDSTSTGTPPRTYATDAAFGESAMDLITSPDVGNPTLAGMRTANHRMILFHGQADPVFSANDTIRWREKLNANFSGQAYSFGGGVGVDCFHALTDWVEKGNAPEQTITSINPDNGEIPGTWSTIRSRPLRHWPKYTKYQGGDVESAASFACIAPFFQNNLEETR